MKKSLEQILKQCETFATAHKQIETFHSKPITENTALDYIYPMMWMDVQGLQTAFQRGQLAMPIPVYHLDRVERDFSNLVTVLSTRLLVADDFYTYFTDNECEFGFYFSDNGGATPVVYDFDDILAGQQMNIVIQVANSRNESQIPMD